MSIKWKLPILAVLLAIAGYGLVASAQVRQTVASSSQSQRQAAPLPAAGPTVVGSTVRRQMPQPGAQEGPGLKFISLLPVELHTYAGKLTGLSREEGVVFFKYDGDRIAREYIGVRGEKVGQYKYDRHGRLDRIDYTDGSSITAQYGADNELASLRSSNGRSMGFAYENRTVNGLVTPTVNRNEFHAAVAVLRMKEVPDLLNNPPQEYAMYNNGEPPPKKEGDPPHKVIVHGTPEPDAEPEVSPIDFIPIGGYLVPTGGQVKEAIDTAFESYARIECFKICRARTEYLTDVCATGPTYSAQRECHLKVAVHWTRRCNTACMVKDYQHKWQKDFPEPIYAPWAPWANDTPV